jgi:hypothetical protein
LNEVRDTDALRRIECHRRQALARAAARAVIEDGKLAPIEIEAVDHARLEIGHEQVLGRGIEGDVAEAGPAVCDALIGHIGE